MGKYFLGSVGKAEAFKVKEDGTGMDLVFVSKTLTDSGLNISTTKDDIRAGQGAPIQFSFYHDPNVEITLTDVLWKKEYLSAQLGANFTELGEQDNEDYVTATVTFDSTTGKAEFPSGKPIVETPIPCEGGTRFVWGAKQGSDEWKIIEVINDGTSEEPVYKMQGEEADKGETYCVRYLAKVENAQMAEISSLIIPQELFLIITAPIFAGDACSASNGKAAGHITFEVPRFQLNGAQEFTMNMSQNQNMSLAGIALASESADCDAVGGKLLRIIEFIDKQDWRQTVKGILIDGESEAANKAPVLYAELKNGKLRKLNVDEVEFRSAEGANPSGDYSTLATNPATKFTSGYRYQFKVAGTDVVSEIVTIA